MPDTTDSPDLLASTGLNDPNSPWNLNGLLQTGVNIGNLELQKALGAQTPLTGSSNSNGAPASQTPLIAVMPKSSSWTTWLIWAAVIALLGWVVLEFRGSR